MTGARSNYDAWHDQLPVDVEADTPWHQLVRRHLDLDRDIRGKRVLEIGCGRGGFALWLRSRARAERLAAAGFSPAAVRRGQAVGREHGVAGIPGEGGGSQHPAHPASSFDTGISVETGEHPPRPAGAGAA